MKISTKTIRNGSLLIILLIASLFSKAKTISPKSNKIYLTIDYLQSTDQDTLTIFIGDNMLESILGSAYPQIRQYTSVKNKLGKFTFALPITQTSGYFELCKNRTGIKTPTYGTIRMLPSQFWEKGDSLNVIIDFKETLFGTNGTAIFTGRGALKYNVMNKLSHPDRRIIAKANPMPWPKGWQGNIMEYDNFDNISAVTKVLLDTLAQFKGKISDESYYVLKANLIYRNRGELGTIRGFGYFGGYAKLTDDEKVKFLSRLNSAYDADNNYGIEDRYLAKSRAYLGMLTDKFETLSNLELGKYSPEFSFKKIQALPNAEIRENLLMFHLIRSYISEKDLNLYYQKARKLTTNKAYLNIISDLEMRMPGRVFSDFQLTDEAGKKVSMRNFKNKVLFIDFWYTACGHCEDYYRDVLSKVENKLVNNPNVAFLSVSIDKSYALFKNTVSLEKYSSKSSITAYTNGQGANHPIITQNRIPSYPWVILIDKTGKIKYFNADILRHEQSLQAAIAELL